jgi:carboxypeptidase C (cathepsin A)
MRIRLGFLVALALLIGTAPALVQDRQPRPERSDRAERPARAPAADTDPQGVLRLLPANAVSEKQTTIAGKPFPYTATAGTLALFDQSGDRLAAVFYTAYVAKSAPAGANAARRPITFVFNGGPGAASAFLHLGLAGPRIIDFGPDGRDGAAAKLRDNPETWLAFTDLVMIDPIGTGWSRTAKPDAAAAFRNVSSDADSIAKVIALYVAHNSRGASPKYLLGESYGGFRAAKVARALQNDQGIIVSGIVMVSPMLETAFQWGNDREPFKAALYLPSLVATELERTKQFTPDAIAAAERFALTDYLSTLAGPKPTSEKAAEFYGQIARMTGLAPDIVAKSGGYVRDAYLEQLRKQGVQVSNYDATFTITDPVPGTDLSRGGDPMLNGFVRALSGVFVGYARDELGFKTDITYTLLSRDGWDWSTGRGGQSSLAGQGVSNDLSALLTLDPSFRLLVAHGRNDLVTPYGVSRYLLDQIRPAGAPERVQLTAYRGGHMFYFSDEQRRAFTADAKMFYQGVR